MCLSHLAQPEDKKLVHKAPAVSDLRANVCVVYSSLQVYESKTGCSVVVMREYSTVTTEVISGLHDDEIKAAAIPERYTASAVAKRDYS